ncbi:small ribosomal subunit Rsm22 family protein [Streptomyces millisiae]|uniref:Small ribosomal subunit Rsm22 family protein n=1 Tax=Streptomyces millisiae TaxID=3075542 RepID=A0ABU2M0H5_9ACTN|nr:small ribosomal subunit Rsm22 family protein [Streptomyces sp. DSM 44918]MDT0323346.1 small ribosomal subunit Rsm22 family protein [Streptomyces sp. DSM 44918]
MTSPTTTPLGAALDRLLDGLPPRQAAAAVERLIASYRGRTVAATPILRDRADAVAYAAYRMPATHQAIAAALDQLAARLPDWAPASHLDLGGGTGAAVWAAADAWPGDRETVVVDWSEPALALGRELAAAAAFRVEWRRERLAPGVQLPAADLVTVSYLLGELPETARDGVVDAAATAAGAAVLVVEPGTPDGYLRVRAARDRLLAAGLRVAAPCPHDAACPIEPGADWCHFAARVGRSALHRRVKGGVLPYEDEKFSYVAATCGLPPATPAPSRVVRRPQLRKGQVLLDLCEPDGDGAGAGAVLRRETVTRRQGAAYRTARDTPWGGVWPAT